MYSHKKYQIFVIARKISAFQRQKGKNMQGYLEDSRFLENGISYPFRTHRQETIGKHDVVSAHYHETIELLLCKKGKFEIVLDGKTDYLNEGDLAIVNSMEMHALKAIDEEVNMHLVVRVSPEILYNTTQTAFEMKYVLPFTMRTSTHQRIFRKSVIGSTDVPALMEAVIREEADKKYGYELAIRTHIGNIFLWILRSWHSRGLNLNLDRGMNQESAARLELVFEYVEEHYDQPITIGEMAELCNVSYSYFSRFFKHHMNRNFSEYVNLIRIGKSEDMLAKTTDSITDIALAVGFTTTSYFIEQFKLYKNMTPKKYRMCYK